VLEARSREYVESRVRAGLLEQNTVDLLHEVGVGERLAREGLDHTGVYLSFRGRVHHVDMASLTGRKITIYGQQEVVKDEIAALLERGVPVRFDVSGVEVHDLDSDRPRITYIHAGSEQELGATSSPAATASTACAAPRFPMACSPSTSSSTPSTGSASWPKRRPRRTS